MDDATQAMVAVNSEDALREALTDIFAAWDAHVEANDRTNAAIPPIGATRAEREVYDERYRASEDAKRDWYGAMHRFVMNPALRAALSHQAIAAREDSLREALAPFGNAYLKAKADWAAGATQSAPSKYVQLCHYKRASEAIAAHSGGMSEAARLREALNVGEEFLDACFSAWSCGEPYHRVKTMMDRADEFRASLASLDAIERGDHHSGETNNG